MGCFGFSLRKLPKKKLSDQDMEEDVVKNGGLKKKTRWISCSGFRRKKSAVKTVPVHSPASDISGSKELQSLKSMKKVSSKKHKQTTGVDMIPAARLDQTINNKAHKKRFEIDKAIILENGDQLDHSNSLVQDDTWQKPSSRKRENKKTGSSRLFTKNLSKRTTTLLPHSISLPEPKRKKQKAISIKDDNAIREIDQKFDPLIGMSILVVTLVIMLLWGKLCAILCTSAWFFMVPRLKTVVNSTVNVENRSNSGGPDLNSDEYKKKVVLEGFLQRNRRSVTGIL